MTRTALLVVIYLLVEAAQLAAQVVIGPTRAEFQHPDTDYAITATYQLDFYQCGSIVNQQCQGRATAPFQSDAAVPKTAVTGPATARVISFTAAPVQGVLQAMPIGTAFVATVVAVGDTAIPGVGGNSPPSTDSNPFFTQARTPVSPTGTAVR